MIERSIAQPGGRDAEAGLIPTTMPDAKASPAYRPDIDGLRAIAILGVVAYHARLPGFSGGFLGVDVFFVISGYLITQLLHKELRDSGRISLAGFYARRARRILPALLTVIAVTLLAGQVLLPPTEREDCVDSALSALVFVANHFFWDNTGGYFDGAAELMPLLHLWSLAVEEQFYLVWPPALLVAARLVRGRSPQLLTLVAVLAAASMIYSLWLKRVDASAAFFLAPSRAWELCAGAFVALLRVDAASHLRRLARPAAWCGGLLILAAYVGVDPAAGFQPKTALSAVLGAALLICGNAIAPDNGVSRLLSTRVLVSLGLVSYSWYLWHWPVLAFWRNMTMRSDVLWQDVIGIVVALLLAMATTRWIENPIRFGLRKESTRPRRVLTFAVAALLCAAALAGIMSWLDARGPFTARDQTSLAIAQDIPEGKAYECTLVRDRWDGELSVEDCSYGDESRPVTVALWGDSHALAWVPMLQALQKQGAPRFVQLTVTGCQPVAAEALRPSARKAQCAEFSRVALEKILELKAQGLKTVVLAGRWSQQREIRFSRYEDDPPYPSAWHWLASLSPSETEKTSKLDDADPLRDGLASVLRQLEHAGLKTLVLLDPPEFKYPLYLCSYYRFGDTDACGVTRAEFEQVFGELRATIQAAAAPFTSVRVIDPIVELCSVQSCPAFWRDMPVLWDDNHLSASAARALAPLAAPAWRWALE